MSDAAEGGGELVLRCAWCDEIRGPDGMWRPIPAVEYRRLEAANLLTHGMCPRCYADLSEAGELYPGGS